MTAQTVLEKDARAAFGHLRLDGVTRRFGRATALSGFDLRIEGGEFIALLGPSGCGKSTALNCLAGLLPLSEGEIWLDGQRVDTLPPERRGFGMVFQNYALFPHLSVRKNVAFGLSVRRTGKAETARRVDEALRTVELTEHADKLPGQLSGGQQQRVAIARAIVLRPKLVLMDEPLSNLDAKLRVQMRTEIRRIHQDLGLTTVYVTHDQEEALALADRVVVLRSGEVEQIGTPEEVYTHPASAYIAGFMGYRNLLELPVLAGGGPAEAGGRVTVGNEGGLVLTGVARQPVPGPRAVAAVRPEDLRVAGPPGSTAGENVMAVRVEVSEFHGREVAAEGVMDDGRVVHFRSPERIAPGDRVALTVAPERVLVFGDGAQDALSGNGEAFEDPAAGTGARDGG
ncbi:ABC transporter ATP-binding protein [Actinomadura livida]|uniref:ABC transporter ATP-binding protein n=1 Tax=Actinomadura livida TaxID=79909 RepID=A0A7W7ICJ4_9ACTN|nr:MULTISPECIES: ABC transporter ATP-binding protein [Actinomadura]MBB4774596.1 putative spermidine/putrescine transport system ATP-binding protein [Actinomadura catellatispora]GGU07227.1 ABC transporter ATP-binding protein [Actinomadura livida]